MEQPINIFASIAKGIETTNLNVVDLFKLVEEQNAKIDAIYSALFPTQNIAEPDVPGAETEE